MKIRSGTPVDIKAMLTIWLDASVTAHSFVDADYWSSKVDEMRDVYLPAATNYVAENDAGIAGFISLVNDTVAALFVSPELQHHGVGSALLSHAKTLHATLTLGVYKDNVQSVDFYTKHGFVVVAEQIETDTQHTELVMTWHGA